MNVLLIGSGKASFQMRAVQLGGAIGARVTMQPSEADWRWADRVILVKHAGLAHAPEAHRRGLPIVWDALDFWKQPDQNQLSDADARRLLSQRLATIQPALTIGATEAMAAEAGGMCLPHHVRLGLAPGPVRPAIRTVGYDGSERYLGRWRAVLERACVARGWRFVINATDLAETDLIIALRDGEWDGWMCRTWKSGVKIGNAIVAGRPVIYQDCAAARELQPAGSVVASLDDLDAALDAWTDQATRAEVVDIAQRRASEFSLTSLADRYRAALEQVEARCTV